MYQIVFSDDAKKDLKELHRKAPMAVAKLSRLLEEIREHPRTGTGQVEQLKGYDGSIYSVESPKNTGWSLESMRTSWKSLSFQRLGIIIDRIHTRTVLEQINKSGA